MGVPGCPETLKMIRKQFPHGYPPLNGIFNKISFNHTFGKENIALLGLQKLLAFTKL